MPKIKVVSIRPQVSIRIRTQWKETFYEQQCALLKNNFNTSLMRLNSVSGKVAEFSAPADMLVCDLLRRGVEKETFFKIIAQVINVIKWLSLQKLSISNLVLRADYVFINSNTKELFMLYVPVDGDIVNGNLKSFLETLAFESSFGIGENTVFKKALVNLVNSDTGFSSKDLENYVLAFCPTAGELIARYGSEKIAKISDTRSDRLRQTVSAQNENTAPQHRDAKGADIYYQGNYSDNPGKGTTVLNQGGGTVVLNEEARGTVILDESEVSSKTLYPKLIRKNTGEEILIDKPVYRIGKEEGSVDFLIPDNPTISRSHADIITKDGKYYLYDNKSTNGSYVNNVLAKPQSDVELSDGASIRLSDEEFEFRIINY